MLANLLLLATSSFLPVLVNADGLFERAQCNADNCARAATGSRGIAQATRLAACSAYQTTTVTYIVSAESITSTPSAVPAFAASQCARAGSYASACSCAGITAAATTILAYPTDTPCGNGSPESGPFQYFCGYGPNPETNLGVPTSPQTGYDGTYESCESDCNTSSACYSFMYNAVSRGCTLYDYTAETASTSRFLQRGAPEDIYAYKV